ncbi:MAG: DUF1631 domain-containing protein [Gammaproteobacteria bacterium]
MGTEKMSDSDYRSASNGVAATLPSLVKQVKENSFAILSNNFSHFFTSCDDLFFDLASKAGSNKEQNLYFDSMREVRIKKAQVWSLFKDGYEEGFRNLTKSRLGTGNRKPQDSVSLESIQLVDKDDMEQDVAIAGIVNKARTDNQELLYQLNCRFDYLLPDVKVNDTNNPLDPAQICQAVSKALRALDMDIRCKVILLKHLDRTVIVELKNIYGLANELMINAGVLPQIRFGVKKHESTGTASISAQPAQEPHAVPAAAVGQPASPAAAAAGSAAPAGTVNLGQMLGLFEQLRQAGVRMPNAVSRPVTATSAPVQQEHLIDALTSLQVSADYLEQPHLYNVRSVIERVLDENRSKGKPDALNQSDEDIINLVAMFFDFVLDDRNLPVPFQALISRLQIPVLKVALKDRDFFSHADHPARKFINEIAAAAVGWDQSEKEAQDLLYKEVNRVVHHVIEHFSGDIAIFVRALDQLQTALKRETGKASVLEKRTQEAAQGKARAEHARDEANSALLKRLREAQIPDNILSFLVREWQKVLMYIHLKHGVDSTEWLEANQVIDDIVWALRPHHDERSLNRVDRLREEVLRKVTHGLEGSSIPRESILNTLSVIEQTFELVLQKRLDEANMIGLLPEHLAALGQGVAIPGKSWEEMTALERQRLKMQAAAQEYVSKASSLRPGTWVIYSPPNSPRTFRCKLAMVTDPGNSYVFVNRFGLRVFEKKLNEVAADLQKGYVKVLDSGVLFDRAMGNISERLKKLAS